MPPIQFNDLRSLAAARARVEKATAAGLLDPHRGKLLLQAFRIATYNLNNMEGA